MDWKNWYFLSMLIKATSLKRLLIRVKEESEKAGLKLNIQKTKIVASGPINSVQFSRLVVSNSLWPHGQHARPPCPSPTPRVYPNSFPLSQWCHPTISSSVIPFSSCLQSFPASASFPMSQFFSSGGQSIGTSASASILPRNVQDWFPLGLTSLDSLQSKGLSRVFSNATVQSINSLAFSFLYSPTLTHMTAGKTIALTRWTFVRKVISLLLNMLSRLVIAFFQWASVF